MKRWGELKPVRFDEKELKTDLGSGNFIFVGSSTDMFAEDIPSEWIVKILEYMNTFPDNKYLLQTKNPERYIFFKDLIGDNMIIGTTIESNRLYDGFMGNTPTPERRASAMAMYEHKKFITIEPVLDFDVKEFATLLLNCSPNWVNIGADTSNSGMPEPVEHKVSELIDVLKTFNSKVTLKKNLKLINT
jgi:protein gp37